MKKSANRTGTGREKCPISGSGYPDLRALLFPRSNYSYKIQTFRLPFKYIIISKIVSLPSLLKNFWCNIIWSSNCAVGQLSSVLFPRFCPPSRVHWTTGSRKVREFNGSMTEVSIEVSTMRFLEAGTEAKI